ncbi:MAG: putative DNA modification/repair radical SAM protein [Peptostreptococcales bacterium]
MDAGNSLKKLRILADAAKYDVSCSSSGVERKNKGGLGNSRDFGICHSWSSDGRCISLLKILMTNKCIYNCTYCVNRCTSDHERASFEPLELANLTYEFYRRNYIEGLFISSAVEKSPDDTMEKIAEVISLLRNTYHFNGYIHAKIIPGTSPLLLEQIGSLADRVSVNIELPSRESLQQLAPQKKPEAIVSPMHYLSNKVLESRDNKRYYSHAPKFAPAGQTTQMIIGASHENDYRILKATQKMYDRFYLKRVYFSAYMPVVDSSLLPALSTLPPLQREHRLYEADWLLRFYHFRAEELIDQKSPLLDLEVDPKLAWALRNIAIFPLEINKASYEELLRIPGIGIISAKKIMHQRKVSAIRHEHLLKMGISLKRARFFITCLGKYEKDLHLDPQFIRDSLVPPHENNQLSFL